MSTNFRDWLLYNLELRSQKPIDLARAADLEPSAIGNFLNGRRQRPSVDTCNAIANAWGLPVEEVMRAAGILPDERSVEEKQVDAITEAILHVLEGLTVTDKKDVLEYAKLRSRLAAERRE